MKKYIISQKTWLCISNGIWICDSEYKALGWSKPRRIIIIRQNTKVRPKADGKQILPLFEEYEENENYRYSCIASNITLPAYQVWCLYKDRANAENKIKEIKYDFGFDSFCLNNFYGTEAVLNFALFAYNLMSLFKHTVLNCNIHNMLSTLRYKLFAMGSFIVKEGDCKILQLSLDMKRRRWFDSLWDLSNKFAMPVTY